MDGFLSTNPQAHRDWGEIEDKASVRFETMGFSCCYVQLGLYILGWHVQFQVRASPAEKGLRIPPKGQESE